MICSDIRHKYRKFSLRARLKKGRGRGREKSTKEGKGDWERLL